MLITSSGFLTFNLLRRTARTIFQCNSFNFVQFIQFKSWIHRQRRTGFVVHHSRDLGLFFSFEMRTKRRTCFFLRSRTNRQTRPHGRLIVSLIVERTINWKKNFLIRANWILRIINSLCSTGSCSKIPGLLLSPCFSLIIAVLYTCELFSHIGAGKDQLISGRSSWYFLSHSL